MSDVDILIKEKLVPFRARVIESVKEKHPYIAGIVESVVSGRKNKFGLQVTEGGTVVGEYTLNLDGINIESVDAGTLAPEVNHPVFGIIKPYAIIERSAVEKAIGNEEFFTDTFAAVKKLLPNVTIKFLA